MIGATFFGVDNYRAGYLAGAALGEWIQRAWGGQLDRLIVLEEPRAGALPGSRIQGMLEGVHSIIGEVPADKRVTLNSGNTSEMSEAQMTEALKHLPGLHRLAVLCFNDDAAMGALDGGAQTASRERRGHRGTGRRSARARGVEESRLAHHRLDGLLARTVRREDHSAGAEDFARRTGAARGVHGAHVCWRRKDLTSCEDP